MGSKSKDPGPRIMLPILRKKTLMTTAYMTLKRFPRVKMDTLQIPVPMTQIEMVLKIKTK